MNPKQIVTMRVEFAPTREMETGNGKREMLVHTCCRSGKPARCGDPRNHREPSWENACDAMKPGRICAGMGSDGDYRGPRGTGVRGREGHESRE